MYKRVLLGWLIHIVPHCPTLSHCIVPLLFKNIYLCIYLVLYFLYFAFWYFWYSVSCTMEGLCGTLYTEYIVVLTINKILNLEHEKNSKWTAMIGSQYFLGSLDDYPTLKQGRVLFLWVILKCSILHPSHSSRTFPPRGFTVPSILQHLGLWIGKYCFRLVLLLKSVQKRYNY